MGLAAALLLLLLALIPSALADGNETLGPPSIPIAQGTGVVTAGTGLWEQPGTIDLNVPSNAQVKQVLVHWEGQHRAGGADDTIRINGQEITGQLIGGPVFFFAEQQPSGQFVQFFSSSYRADITSLEFVAPGANTLTVDGLSFDFANDGASVTAIFDDGTDPAVIDLRDGVDIAHSRFAEPRRTTVPQTFTFAPADFTRTAQLDLSVGSVAPDRPNAIKLTVGGEESLLFNQLGDSDGPEWDTLSLPVQIPAGVTEVSVELLSREDGTGRLPASLIWVAATFAVTDCPPASDIPQKTSGRAYGADADVLALNLIKKLGLVATKAPGSPSDQGKQVARVNVVGLADIGVVTTSSSSTLVPSPKTTSSATIAGVNLLSGAIRADTVTAVSTSIASTSGASHSSAGSGIQNLRINGKTVADIKPGMRLLVKNPLPLLSNTIAEVHVYEEKGSSTASGGEARASHSVNMLRVVLLQSFLGLPKGAEIIVGHAESSAQSPMAACPKPGTVSGEAFTALVKGKLLGSPVADLKVGSAVLPPTGGSDEDGLTVDLPGVVVSQTAHNSTSGSLQPHPNATARSRVEGLNILKGLITADVLDVRSTSSATGTDAGTTFSTTLLNLRVGGIQVAANAPPNTIIPVTLPLGGFAVVIVNERTVTTNGTTDTEGTVNALRVRVFSPLGLLESEIIVASAHSDAHK